MPNTYYGILLLCNLTIKSYILLVVIGTIMVAYSAEGVVGYVVVMMSHVVTS